MIRRALLGAVVGLVAICGGPATALAHPLLDTASPAPGVIAPHAPAELELAFSEGAVAGGSRISVKGPHGRPLALGRLRASAGGKRLGVALPRRVASGVYRVHWVALGDDGHTVSGDFSFGVAGPHGAPPQGAETLGGGTSGSRGGSAAVENMVSVVARWLGVLAASLLWGGVALGVALWRRRVPGYEQAFSRLSSVLPLAWLAALLAATEGVFAEASAGAGGNLDFDLLTSSGTGWAALLRIALLGAGSLVLARLGPRRARARLALYGAGGLGVLLTYALSGHVLAQGTAWAQAAMAAHVLGAGLWAGGLVALILIVARDGEPGAGAVARAFAPLAAGGLSLAAATGVVSAVREVHGWYFLRWSDYGRVVILKVLLVAGAAAAGAFGAWRARRGAAPRARLLRLESGLVVAVLGLAALLGGLAQGRGQPLPAQRGDLLPGPAIGTALLGNGSAPTTLAPARPGANVISVLAPASARSVSARLTCGCSARPFDAVLRHAPGGGWSAPVSLPRGGNWYAYLRVDGHAASSPVALTVGVPSAPGAPVRNVLSLADLSGPGAARCRSFELGLELALGRLNATGGVDGGHKIAPLVLDDGGSARRAAAQTARALGGGKPLAVVPCGQGSEPSVAAGSRAGVPSLIGDPALGTVQAARAFRVAADPYADGVALGQAVRSNVVPAAAAGVHTLRVVAAPDAQGARRLAGLRAALSGSDVQVSTLPPGAVATASPSALRRLLERGSTLALVLDGDDADAGRYGAALRALGRRTQGQAPVIASERVLSEQLVEAAGDEGRIGLVQGTSSVSVDSRDALALSQTIPALYPGEHPSLEALRGYVTGLALLGGLHDGTAPGSIARRLARPQPFTDALGSPWRSDAPAAGSQRLVLLAPTFLSTTLVPPSQGGESYTGSYFPDGAWAPASTALYGPSFRAALPGLRASVNGKSRG